MFSLAHVFYTHTHKMKEFPTDGGRTNNKRITKAINQNEMNQCLIVEKTKTIKFQLMMFVSIIFTFKFGFSPWDKKEFKRKKLQRFLSKCVLNFQMNRKKSNQIKLTEWSIKMEMSWKITYPAVNKIEIKKISHFTFQFF